MADVGEAIEVGSVSLRALSCAFANLKGGWGQPPLPSTDSGDPLAEIREILVWTWDDLDSDHLANALGGFGAGFDGGFE